MGRLPTEERAALEASVRGDRDGDSRRAWMRSNWEGRLAPVRRPAPRLGGSPSVGVLAAPAGLLVAIVALPLLALVLHSITSPTFVASLTSTIVLQALRVTAASTAIALALVVLSGTPLAYLLARRDFVGRRVVSLLVDLPLVLPPVVAGVALLMAFGRRGILGSILSGLGVEIPFTLTAVVLAQAFVAGPFYVRSAAVGFGAIDGAIEDAASIDGASAWSSFRHVTLPLAAPGIASGAVLCFGRALSEFGATLLFAGNFTGRTQTMSLAIMEAMESDLSAALALSVLLVVAATAVLTIAWLVGQARYQD